MVDTDQIVKQLHEYFYVPEHVIDPISGHVSTHAGPCISWRPTSSGHLPVTFENAGYFDCGNMNLKTLKGAPHTVANNFVCSQNSLQDLQHAPQFVGQDFDCRQNPLISLEGLPKHVGRHVWVTYSPFLPLLRLCDHASVIIEQASRDIKSIMEKYAGTGRSGALLAAAELIRAGYRENARW